MRFAALVGAFLAASSVMRLQAQQAERPISLEAIRQGLAKPQAGSLVIPPGFVPDANKRLGFLTLVPSTRRGQIVNVAVPIGEAVTHLARKVSTARYQRRERKAREAVERDLRMFLTRQP